MAVLRWRRRPEVSNNDGAVSARPPPPYNVCEIATEVSDRKLPKQKFSVFTG